MNHQNARQFLETLFTRYFQSNEGQVELRFNGIDTFSKFLDKGELTETDWLEIERINRTHNVFVGVNPRFNQARRQNDIKTLIGLWADLDGKDFVNGKTEAYAKVKAFPIAPSVIVDSGHGFHCYWVFAEPYGDITEARKKRFKKILSGVLRELGADKSKVHLDACLRLPGTRNLKAAAIAECRLLEANDNVYSLADFERFIDESYEEPRLSDEPLPEFGTKSRIIRSSNERDAIADVEALTIPTRVKKLIITGALIRGKNNDGSRSVRDYHIICSLIYHGYDYATIKSIFLNGTLKCSNRIIQEGEDKLRWDVKNALEDVKLRSVDGTPQSQAVMQIKTMKMAPEEKRVQINALIVKELLTGPSAEGIGFKDRETQRYFFFSNELRELMAIDGEDFYYHLREKFGISRAECDERRDAVKTAVKANGSEATSHKFAYFDKDTFTVYVSDHDNGIYKINENGIYKCTNGTDGVFFEVNPRFAPFTVVADSEPVMYFAPARPKRTIKMGEVELTFPGADFPGFDLERYFNGGSLLKKYVLGLASFEETEENPLSPDEQELVLLFHTYSQFFESVMQDKPITCFIGLKASGKSTLATSIGKLFFGPNYQSRSLPQTPHDTAVVMSSMPYVVIDNLDSGIKGDTLNLLCAAATGVTESNRALFTDAGVSDIAVHCFLAITSREPKFTRDDFASRLLIFHTQKIENPISPSVLREAQTERRNAIMTEVLANLVGIVARLKMTGEARHQLEKERSPVPEGATWRRSVWGPVRCLSRNADWETWAVTCCNWKAVHVFRNAIAKMNEEKSKFVLEDNPIYQVLNYILYENTYMLRNLSGQALYSRLVDSAAEMKMTYFQKAVKSARSLTRSLANIAAELRQEMVVEIATGRGREKSYTFKAFGDKRPDSAAHVPMGCDEEPSEDTKPKEE